MERHLRALVGMDPKDDPEGAKALEDAFAAGKLLIGKEAHDHFTYFESFLAGYRCAA